MNSICPAPSTRCVIAGLALTLGAAAATAQTPLADQPIFTSIAVPGNLALALSVEFPTAVSVAHKDGTYKSATAYLGYFDPNKCYEYKYNADEQKRHFAPSRLTANRTCAGEWSGNFLNWATMQTIDPFRWALTGGYRSYDGKDDNLTILEKAWASPQLGNTTNFPDRLLPSAIVVSGATPLNFNSLNMRVLRLGNKLIFSSGTLGAGTTAFEKAPALPGITYQVSVRVRVCDASIGLESNCEQYPNGNYKPIGLIQKYSDKIRYSAFGYLNDNSLTRDGGVLRAQQKFVGPSQPVPGGLPTGNAAAEWYADTGVMKDNPNPLDAAATAATFDVTIENSGVMNYLNKFGELTKSDTSYKTFDPVGELYYTALRYYKKLGNVPEYTSMTGNKATKTAWADGFPVITNWDDPVQYSCQKNFILGIGDTNTHADRNLPGAAGSSEPGKPAAVVADRTVDALIATNTVGTMHGLGNFLGTLQNYGGCCNNNGALMAGLAYDANTVDIRPDITGKQTVQTYWLDVLETGYKNNNQFALAAKYGGFAVPDGYVPYPRTTDIPQSWWYTTTDTVGTQPRPDNYFTAGQPDLMVAGLTKAFSSIASKLTGYSTGFVTATPQFSSSGVGSYAARYDASNWSGDVIGNTVSFDLKTNVVSSAQAWQFSSKLAAQAAGTGWRSGRLIATFNNSGVPFRIANLTSTQVNHLDTAYRPGSDSADYLDYLRGDSSQEKGSAVANSSQAYRSRSNLVGDIVGAQLLVVGPPAYGFSEATNPGYASFKSAAANANRKTVVYAGTNRGMLHAIDGSLTGTTAGNELFAYVPGGTFAGPTGTSETNGLRSLGNPDFTHYNFVDATPISADVDLGRTVGGSGTDWRTLLIGGLGKGGKSFYALDVTAPATWTSETAVASKVLWEFTDGDMGYSYGQAALAKTKKYGWVAIFGSGYNNADGKGYFFIVNPRTGGLLEKISTGVGSASNPAGLARVKPFYIDVTDGTADSVYAGDLLGNVWRLDVSAASGAYPAPVRLAQLIDAANQPLPITSRPTIAVHPKTNRRYVTVGTGRLLSGTDLGSAQGQRFYAILDGTGSAFSQTQPNTSSYPVQTSDLKPLTDLSQPIKLDLTRHAGWYVDLGTLSAGPGWRVIIDPISFYGGVSFAAMAPSSSDACNPAGNSRVYSIDLGSGQSLLPSNSSYLDVSGVVISLTGASVSGQYRIVPATTDGPKQPIVQNPLVRENARRLNWREIPLTN